MSANLSHFLPMLKLNTQKKIFSRARTQQWLNAMDVTLFAGTYPWRIQGWNDFRKRLIVQPGIIASFHFGAYQLICYLMVKAKIPFVLLVAATVKDDWTTRNAVLLEALEEARAEGRFVLLDANSPAALRQLYSLPKQGFQILVFADGLETVVSKDSPSLEQVSFLGQNIAVGRGVAQLAHTLQLPIYPMIAHRKNKSVQLETLPSMFSIANTDRRIFATAVLNKLFGWFATFVIRSPEQWTLWSHIHALRGDEKLALGVWYTQESDSFKDSAKYGVFKMGDYCYVLRKKDMKCFSISKAEFETLARQWYTEHTVIR